MGGGIDVSYKQMKQDRERNSHLKDLTIPYLPGFQTPSLATEADKVDCKTRFPDKIMTTIGITYGKFVESLVKTCSEKEVKFSIVADQTVLEGKVKKFLFAADDIILKVKGRTNENPISTDYLTLENDRGISKLEKRLFGQKFDIASYGIGGELKNEDGTWIEMGNKPVSHSSEGMALRLLNHVLHLEDSLQKQTAKITVGPLVK